MAPPLLVCVFLRGAADGLSLVPPYADPDYAGLRPTLGLRPPDDRRAEPDERALELDGRFGLHPALASLAPLYRSGELAVVHGAGSDDTTRSHFEAQDRMEHAGPADRPLSSGWLARHLATRPGPRPGALSAVAIGTQAPEALRGAAAATLLDAGEYRLTEEPDPAFAAALEALHAPAAAGSGGAQAALRRAGLDTLDVAKRLEALSAVEPRGGLGYPDEPLGRGLREIARLAKADVGLEVACVDHGNWDTHFVQAGLLPDLARTLATSLAAFRADLAQRFEGTLVVVLTEFGRRAYENTSLGTDHGRGGVAFALGPGIAGGRVLADWRGLRDDVLEPPGDLPVTIDYRDLLWELVAKIGGKPAEVFPGFTHAPRGLVRG